MPLPHFLFLVAVIILFAGVTLWASVAAGIPLAALAVVALMGAAVLHLSMRDHEG
ncbi:MAG: hypothetical protein Q4G49_05300 [Paracoccus sp. (in: a-proteobacteria)]|nr:hypothetical protein [Paracoccus sp. (in: a-proteobacteria)]